jgi:hypothetical protein
MGVTKINVPPRIHVFHWLVGNNEVLTWDNLAKRVFRCFVVPFLL